MIPVRCQCGFSFDAQDGARGREVECLQCRARLVIGAPPARAAGGVPRVEIERRVGSTVVVLRCAETFAFVAEALLEVIATAGSPRAGAVFTWGAAPVFLEQEAPGRLRVCEPDLRLAEPLSRPEPDVTNALVLSAFLASIHRAVGVQAVSFGLLDNLLVYRGTLNMAKVFLYRKDAARPVDDRYSDSGWQLLASDPEGWVRLPRSDRVDLSNYRRVPIFEIYYRRPALVAALGLPVDYVALADGNRLLQINDGNDRPVWRFDPDVPL